jgi:transposase
MRTGTVVEVTTPERDRLEAILADRNSPQKHVWRAGIVLATVDGLGTVAIMRHTAKSKKVVWRLQERFAQEGVDGLLRDKTRPSRVKLFGPEVAERIVAWLSAGGGVVILLDVTDIVAHLSRGGWRAFDG